MTTHMNETLTKIASFQSGWDDGVISVGVFTGEDAYVEQFPVCLEFPDNEPCLTIQSARLLAQALIEAADLAAKALPPEASA